MNEPKSLQRQLRISYYILSILLSLTFTCIFLFAEEYVEQKIIYTQLSKQLEHAIRHYDESNPDHDILDDFRIFTGNDVPDYISTVPVDNAVHEINQNGKDLAILSVVRNDKRYFIVSDQHALELVESTILVFLVITAIAALVISYLFSVTFVKSIIHPLIELSLAVKAGALDNSPLVNLDDEIGFLAKTIVQKDHQLAEFLERETRFTSDASHELRTPLTIILGAAELLQTQLRHDQTAIAHVQRIYRNAEDAAGIVSALLLLARSPERLDAPRTDLTSLVSEELSHSAYLLANKPVTVRQELNNAYVFVRPELARAAIGNLIRNAFQYTESGEVFVFLDPQKIIVEDTGEGLPQSVETALYERFVRGHAHSGSGLGLSIVDRICRHVGWLAQYDKTMSGGSRFTLKFKHTDVS